MNRRNLPIRHDWHVKEESWSNQDNLGRQAPRSSLGIQVYTKEGHGRHAFALVYGSDAVLPTETCINTTRSMNDTKWNDEILALDRDTIDERQEVAFIRKEVYQQALSRSHDKKIRVRKFKPGDHVLRKVFQNTKIRGDGKLTLNWEGPYTVIEAFGQ